MLDHQFVSGNSNPTPQSFHKHRSTVTTRLRSTVLRVTISVILMGLAPGLVQANVPEVTVGVIFEYLFNMNRSTPSYCEFNDAFGDSLGSVGKMIDQFNRRIWAQVPLAFLLTSAMGTANRTIKRCCQDFKLKKKNS